jgi:hypothetical protein
VISEMEGMKGKGNGHTVLNKLAPHPSGETPTSKTWVRSS